MREDTRKGKGQIFGHLNSYVFDVDGVLCDRGKVIDKDFKNWFIEWMQDKQTFIVTGNTKEKTIIKIGQEILDHSFINFYCLGNVINIGNKDVFINQFTLLEDERKYITQFIKDLGFKYKTGNHFDIRTGSINISFPGQDSLTEHRQAFIEYDNETNVRLKFVKEFCEKFPKYDAGIGGDVSVDIFLRGCGKEQIIEQITGKTIMYFGDRPEQYGIDHKVMFRFGMPPFAAYPITNSYHELKEILQSL